MSTDPIPSESSLVARPPNEGGTPVVVRLSFNAKMVLADFECNIQD